MAEVNSAYLAPGDADWYSLSVRNPGQVRIITWGRLDKQLSLYDSGGRELVMADDSESNDNARIARFLQSGTYFILLKGRGRNIVGSYRLRTSIRENPVFDKYDPDSAPEDAKEIEIGEVQRRIFMDDDDEDWVFFTVKSAGNYRIKAIGEQGGEMDTFLELFDSNQELIAEDDDGGDGYSALIQEALTPGLYYMRVTYFDEESDQYYLLSVERY
jgi:hypothetical protein